MESTLRQCENCGTPLQGDFCHECGQRGVELRRPVIGLAQDIIVETLSIDSKLFRTFRGLLLNPGKVAHNYISGKRAQYTPPFRIYLFMSLVFFASIFLLIGRGDNTDLVSINLDADIEGEASSGDQVVPGEEASAEGLEDNSHPPWDEVEYNGPDWLEGFAERVYENIQQVEKDPRLFLANIRDNIPRVMLLMPVVYALLLLIFYFYKKNVYVYDLLIISLYMHAALYFYLIFAILFQVTPLSEVPIIRHGDNIVQLWAVFQTFRVLAINFATKWWAVLLKGLVINMLFWTMVSILIVTGMAVSLFY